MDESALQAEWQAIRRYLDDCLPKYRVHVLARLKRWEGAPLTQKVVEGMWEAIQAAEVSYTDTRSLSDLRATARRAGIEVPKFPPPPVTHADVTGEAKEAREEANRRKYELEREERRTKALLRDHAEAEARRVEVARQEEAKRRWQEEEAKRLEAEAKLAAIAAERERVLMERRAAADRLRAKQQARAEAAKAKKAPGRKAIEDLL